MYNDMPRYKKYLATFAYGYPRDFLFYFWDYFRKNSEALRKSLLALGVFRESGDWTLTAELTPETLARMDDVFDFILDQMDKLLEAQGDA